VEAQRQTVPVLTPRQLQLLRRVADGHTNRQIARDVGLSEGTVRKHLEHIRTRLEIGSRTEALARLRDILAS
jgi:DNA-binding CsgD family transcriptional regulator